MPLKLFNTLGRKLEEFKPIDPKNVRVYTCGPTVYDYAHIGNFRSYIFADILLRTIRFLKFPVTFVENITDVGHLTDDADSGEDKMEVGSREQGKSAWEIAEIFTRAYQEDAKKLNLLEPNVWAKATDHIPGQIEFIEELEQKGFTYLTSDGVYFDSSKLSDYGKLAGLDTAGLMEGARVEKNPEKLSPTDFALWKFSPKNQKRQMEWDSPWGKGFPGWHIECSAMSRKYLGFPFDIHTGGIDHIPVHHTNEIAQNEALFGKLSVNFWMHNEFITVDGGKMAKSLKNTYTLADLEAKGFSPLAYRYLVLLTHYRQKLNFTWDSLAAAATAYRRLVDRLADFLEESEPENRKVLPDWENKLRGAIENDLNTPEALGVIWELVKDVGTSPGEKFATITAFDDIIGLKLEESALTEVSLRKHIPENIQKLVAERENARQEQNWAQADSIREKIKGLGYGVEDTEEGPRLRKTH